MFDLVQAILWREQLANMEFPVPVRSLLTGINVQDTGSNSADNIAGFITDPFKSI